VSDKTIVWFSCGAPSAVCAKLCKGAEIVYCDTGSEHPDNKRFLKDVEKWTGRKVNILKSTKYGDIWDVFQKTRYLSGVNGARCTLELKKNCVKTIKNQVIPTFLDLPLKKSRGPHGLNTITQN